MENLIILHGAIGAADQLAGLSQLLEAGYNVHTVNFSGHGGVAMPKAPFSIKLFAEDVLKEMDENGITTASFFGYSMGGYVAMYLAKYYPERVHKIITLATKFHWDEETAQREVKMLDAEKIAQKLPDFAAALEKRHAPNDWKQVLNNTKEMLISLGADNPLKEADYTTITQPALVLLGDRDKMVSLDETVAVYKVLPNAQLGILPATPHPIEQVDKELLSYHISRFI